MRRIPTGTTDQYIFFVAVDSTDYKTFETGLTSFTVYRVREGGAATAYTTPTVSEVSSANMPGVYKLLIDEDMTIGSGNKSEEVCLRITQASMAPVTVVFELYRPDVTDGETLTVSSGVGSANVTQFGGSAGTFSGGRPEVNTSHAAGTAWNSGAIAAATFATDAITAAKIAADAGSEIATAVWASGTRTLTSYGNNLSQADIRTATGLASANLDTQLSTITGRLPSALVGGRMDSNVSAINNDATAAVNLAAAAKGIVPSTCASGSTTTSVVTNLTEATDDHYNGRAIVFTSGALAGQGSPITAYNGTTKTLTVDTLTESPANTDSFVIV